MTTFPEAIPGDAPCPLTMIFPEFSAAGSFGEAADPIVVIGLDCRI
jgi:hypothetical protein